MDLQRATQEQPQCSLVATLELHVAVCAAHSFSHIQTHTRARTHTHTHTLTHTRAHATNGVSPQVCQEKTNALIEALRPHMRAGAPIEDTIKSIMDAESKVCILSKTPCSYTYTSTHVPEPSPSM